MYRRDFLKLGSLFSLSMLMPLNALSRLPNPQIEAETRGLLYRGTWDGDILVSEDAGATWRLHTRFGSDCSITRLSLGARQQVVARIEYRGYPFFVVLAPNSKNWLTM